LLILDLWGISFHAAVVFGLGKDFLFRSAIGHCGTLLSKRSYRTVKLDYLFWTQVVNKSTNSVLIEDLNSKTNWV
jgi:hypothetical protein